MYYYRANGKAHGPVVMEQLNYMYTHGMITGETLIYHQGTSQWVKYSSLHGSLAGPRGGAAAKFDASHAREMSMRVYASLKQQAAAGEMPLRTTRFVLSLVSLVLALYLIDQADTISALSDLANAFGGHVDTATGGFLGLCHLASGIVGICAYVKRHPGCLIASAVILVVGVLFSLDVGAYRDLYLFDLITAGFAAVYWIAIFKR